MMSKYWVCGLWTAVVLICGCAEKTSRAQKDAEGLKLERNIVKSESNVVKLETSMGDIVIELDKQAAPVTVENFLEYVGARFYDGTIFHRVIRDFMIQGGGLTAEMEEKQTRAPIVNEASNGLSNKRGSIAMARKPDPDSATCQFFINDADNAPLDYAGSQNPGYAVFGKVIEGMDVVDAIAAVRTTTRKSKKGVDMTDVPVEPVVIKSARVVPK